MFSYVDDNAAVWNKRGVQDASLNGIDGSTALTAGQPVWIDSKRRRTRKARFVDPTTFRSVLAIVYTPAAYAALTSASTITVSVPGEATGVTYNLAEKIGEKNPVAAATRQVADHA